MIWLLIVLTFFALSFGITSFCFWLFCIAFEITFTWMKAFVVWLFISLIYSSNNTSSFKKN